MNVTCYSRGSSPPAELAWKVNDDKVRLRGHMWHGCSILQQYWLINVSDLWREDLRGDVRRRGDRWKVWQLPVSVWQQGGRLHSPRAKGEIISSSDSESRVKTSISHWTENNERFLQVAEPQFLFGTIRDWFGKHTDKLDTAASNLHFYVQEHHKHTGDKCIYKYRSIFEWYLQAWSWSAQPALVQPTGTSARRAAPSQRGRLSTLAGCQEVSAKLSLYLLEL